MNKARIWSRTCEVGGSGGYARRRGFWNFSIWRCQEQGHGKRKRELDERRQLLEAKRKIIRGGVPKSLETSTATSNDLSKTGIVLEG